MRFICRIVIHANAHFILRHTHALKEKNGPINGIYGATTQSDNFPISINVETYVMSIHSIDTFVGQRINGEELFDAIAP